MVHDDRPAGARRRGGHAGGAGSRASGERAGDARPARRDDRPGSVAGHGGGDACAAGDRGRRRGRRRTGRGAALDRRPDGRHAAAIRRLDRDGRGAGGGSGWCAGLARCKRSALPAARRSGGPARRSTAPAPHPPYPACRHLAAADRPTFCWRSAAGRQAAVRRRGRAGRYGDNSTGSHSQASRRRRRAMTATCGPPTWASTRGCANAGWRASRCRTAAWTATGTLGRRRGRLSTRLTSVQPYLRWSDGGTTIWATAGGGSGTAENERVRYGLQEESELGAAAGAWWRCGGGWRRSAAAWSCSCAATLHGRG